MTALVLQDAGWLDAGGGTCAGSDEVERITAAGGERLRTAAAERARRVTLHRAWPARRRGMTLEIVLQSLILACAVYLVLVYSSYLVLMAVSFVEARDRRREERIDDLAAIGVPSRRASASFLAAFDEERAPLRSDPPRARVRGIRGDRRQRRLDRRNARSAARCANDLVPVEEMSRDVVETEPILAYYRSEREPRLLVIDKANGGKADALNATLNHARYRYVCGVDADMVFARDALSRAMRTLSRDPATIVGLTSYVEIAEDPSRARPGRRVRHPRIEAAGQRTRRSTTCGRSSTTASPGRGSTSCSARSERSRCGARPARRARWLGARVHLRGHRAHVPVHKVLRERRVPYRVVCIPDRVGVTEGPNTVRKLVAQRERWQRVILETWWAYRHMCFRRRYGSVPAFSGMPFYLLSEVIAPVFELTAIATLFAGAAAGFVDWWHFFFVSLAITLANVFLNAGALLLVDLQAPVYRVRGILRLFALMPFELLSTGR